MVLPLKGRVTSGFGYRIHPITKAQSFHNGIDIAAPSGTKIVSPSNGVVHRIWDDPKGGKSMSIINGAGLRFGFAHLSKRLVKAGEQVSEGQAIAEVGSTGASTGPHLHFTVSINAEFVDPAKFFAL